MPRRDGGAPASERLFSPRQFVTLGEAHRALELARHLIDAGNPVFRAQPATRSGNWDPSGGVGGSGYWFPKEWETTPVSHATLAKFRHGDALAMVTGHALDVLDIDPRNGGLDSFETLRGLGLIPDAVAKAATPSGGAHLFIPSLGVRKTKRDGIDLQAGVGGDGHGFVWIAPTVRRSKAGDGALRPYRWLEPLQSASVGPADDRTAALVEWFHEPTPTTSRADQHYWNGDTEEWLTRHTTGATLSHAVAHAVKPFIDGEPFNGHHRMVKFQVHLVRLAAEGSYGVPEALKFARTVWLDTPHASDEDPAQEWDVALDHAIQKYGGTQ